MKQLIVLGNGFDRACKLKSSYSDFFLARFKKIFGSGKEEFKTLEDMANVLERKRSSIICDIGRTKSNINFFPAEDHDCDYFKSNSYKWSDDTSLNRWDVIFLFAQLCIGKDVQLYEWQDVESIIFETVSIALNEKYNPKVSYKDEVIIGVNSMSGQKAFKKSLLT